MEGKANKELVKFLSKLLGCPTGEVRLLRGEGSRQKMLEVPGAVWERLPPLK